MKQRMKKLAALCLILTIVASVFGSQVASASQTGSGSAGVAFTTGPRTVTFLRNDGTTGVHATVVVDGGSSIRETPGVQMPGAPSRADGHTFVGWNTRSDGTGEWFSDRTVVLDNIIVYARWTQHWYTVQFIDRDGTPISTMRVPHGGSAIAPPNPSIDGWIFIGWDRPFTNVTEDITIRAVYREIVVEPTPPPVVPTPPPIVPTPLPIVPTPPPVIIAPTPEPPVIIVNPPAPPPAAPIVIVQPQAQPQPAVAPPQDELVPEEEPEEEPEEPVIVIIEPEPIPAAIPEPEEPETILEEPEIPLAAPGFIFFAPMGSEYCALLNFILAVLGAILIPIALIKVLQIRNRLEREAVIKFGSTNHDGAYVSNAKNPYRRSKLEWFTATAVLGGIGILLFVLTQDMTKTMALMDVWTFIHAIIFTVEAVTFKVIYKKENE
jgi:uncharacterized repeat protein (TIGR02543 family)